MVPTVIKAALTILACGALGAYVTMILGESLGWRLDKTERIVRPFLCVVGIGVVILVGSGIYYLWR